MSVLLALLTFALVMILGRLLKRGAQPSVIAPAETLRRFRPRVKSKFGMDVPRGYCFHPCHTWAVDEGWQLIRVGVDSFSANLFGKIEHIDVAGLHRWVRQGQKLMAITGAGISVDLPSPVEGVLTEVNRAALENPRIVYLCSGMVLAGLITNRLNTCITSVEAATNSKYLPGWNEFLVAYSIVALGVAAFSLIAKRLPLFPKP